MTNSFLYLVGLFCIQLVSSQLQENGNVGAVPKSSSGRTSSDLVSSLLTGLGELIVDIDETFSRAVSPKVEMENEMKRIVATRSPFRNYLEQVRQNYGQLQRRLGPVLRIPSNVAFSSDLVGLNVQNEKRTSLVDVSMPFLPFKLLINAKSPDKDSVDVKESSESAFTPDSEVATSEELPIFSSDLKLGSMELNVNTKSEQDLTLDTFMDLKPNELQMRSSKSQSLGGVDVSSPVETENLARQESRETEDFRKRKETEEARHDSEDSGKTGRVLGEVMYSESTFDKLMKRLIKDHGKWALDSDLHPSRIIQKVSRVFNLPQGINPSPEGATDSINKDAQRSSKTTSATGRVNEKQKLEEPSTDITKRNEIKVRPSQFGSLDGKNRDYQNGGKLNFVPELKSKAEQVLHFEINKRESIILAFTSEGVPLKLRMDSEIRNPVKYLHAALTDAEVSLNIPVDSNENSVGKDILQLGSESDGLLKRALYVDLSRPDQLRSFLKSLRKIKAAYRK